MSYWTSMCDKVFFFISSENGVYRVQYTPIVGLFQIFDPMFIYNN